MNVFNIENVPNKKELIEILAESKNVRIERIISSGQISPEGFLYDRIRKIIHTYPTMQNHDIL